MSYPPPPQPPSSGYGPGYGPVPRSNDKAVWALVLGILGLLCCGIAAIAAVVVGAQAKNEIAASGGAQTGAGQAQAGFVLGIIGCALWALGIIVYVVGIAAARS